MTPGVRKLALTVHLTCSVGWIGAVVAYLALGVAAVTSPDSQVVRAAWTAMDVTGWWAVVPLATAALLTGLVMSLGTRWGLFRHYWVLISLVLTILSTVVLVVHMPTVSATARLARTADGSEFRGLGGDLFHPGVGLLVLLAITVLNVYKPAGLTPYGWRKQREQRHVLQTSTPHARSTVRGTPVRAGDVQQPPTFRALTARLGYFVLYFAEMWFAMMVGMAVFMVVRLALAAQGYTALWEATSIESQAWMGVFMVAPMVAWMRVRACGWREGAEMNAAMLLPTAVALVLRGLDLRDALLWLSANQHTAMLVGMLALMLYRRERYTGGYAFGGRTDTSRRRTSPGATEGLARREQGVHA